MCKLKKKVVVVHPYLSIQGPDEVNRKSLLALSLFQWTLSPVLGGAVARDGRAADCCLGIDGLLQLCYWGRHTHVCCVPGADLQVGSLRV